MKPILDNFHRNMQVDDFEKGRPIRFANPDCLPEFEAKLKARGLEYVLVKGLYDYPGGLNEH